MSDLRKDNLCDLCSSNFFLVYAMTPNLSICAGLILLVQIGILTNKFTFLLSPFLNSIFFYSFFPPQFKIKMYFLFLFLYQFSQSKFSSSKNDMKTYRFFSLSLSTQLILYSYYAIFDENKKKIIHFCDR